MVQVRDQIPVKVGGRTHGTVLALVPNNPVAAGSKALILRARSLVRVPVLQPAIPVMSKGMALVGEILQQETYKTGKVGHNHQVEAH